MPVKKKLKISATEINSRKEGKDGGAKHGTADAPAKASFLGIFSDSTVFPQLGKFLGINDTRKMIAVSNEIRLAVFSSCYRGPVSILHEIRDPTRILFTRLEVEDEEEARCKVSQLQDFKFKVAIRRENNNLRHRAVAVQVALRNVLWMEEENEKIPLLQHEDQAGPTCLEIDVLDKEGNQLLGFSHYVAIGDPERKCSAFIFTPTEEDRVQEEQGCSEEDKKTLQRFMPAIYACVKRVADWQQDQIDYPSLGYLFHSFPQWSHPYFPPEEKEEIGVLKEAQSCPDRDTVVEFTYQPAPSMETWHSILPPAGPWEAKIYLLDELEWYQKKSVSGK